MRVHDFPELQLPSPKGRAVRKPILTARTATELHFGGPTARSNRSGKSHNSNKSRFTGNMGSLMKSSLYDTIRSKEKGQTIMDMKDKNSQISLLTQSMSLMERQEDMTKQEIGIEMIRLRSQGMQLLEELIRD